MRAVCSILAVLFLSILAIIRAVGAGSEDTNMAVGRVETPPEISEGTDMKVIFLHHSTGEVIWKRGVPEWFEGYNAENGTVYQVEERFFPKGSPYPWNNYPYDYWNIWVEHGGAEPFMEEPTLEILTRQYDVVVWKHCFPVCNIEEDAGNPDIGSKEKRIENYRLQYEALKAKMHEFPDTRFIVWTGAAQVKNASLRTRIVSFLKGTSMNEEKARRARDFFEWVKNEWDETGDNIYLWDFYELETEGGLYLKEEYAVRPTDSHPGESFSREVAPLLCRRIVDVIEGRGDTGSITGR